MLESALVFDATETNFEAEVIQASLTTPVLVDFWAAWCGPCKTLGPILEKVVASYNGAVKLAKVDTDAQMQLAAVFGIRSLPTVVLVKDGQMVDGFMGAVPESAVREFLQRHVQPGDAQAPAEPAPAVAETPEQSIARLQQELALHPERAEIKLDLALAYMRAGLADAAQTELDSLPANLAEDANGETLAQSDRFFARSSRMRRTPPRCARASRRTTTISTRTICSAFDCWSTAKPQRAWMNSCTSCARSATGTTVRPRNA